MTEKQQNDNEDFFTKVIVTFVNTGDQFEDAVTTITNKPFVEFTEHLSNAYKKLSSSYQQVYDKQHGALRLILYFIWSVLYFLIALWTTSVVGNFVTIRDAVAKRQELNIFVTCVVLHFETTSTKMFHRFRSFLWMIFSGHYGECALATFSSSRKNLQDQQS